MMASDLEARWEGFETVMSRSIRNCIIGMLALNMGQQKYRKDSQHRVGGLYVLIQRIKTWNVSEALLCYRLDCGNVEGK